MAFNTIEYKVDSGVAVVVLNRSERMNSFNTEMHSELRQALDQVSSNSAIRCLLLTANGKGFCAGQDLNDRKFDPDASPDLGLSLIENYNPLIRTITNLQIPVICAMNGVAAGAGVGISLACDIVIAARSASFVLSFCKVGLGMDSASSWSLPRLIGLPRAKGLALLGEKLAAEKAEQWGLIWKCVDDDQLIHEAMEMAQHFATQPTMGLGIIKQELLESTAHSFEQQLDMEAELQAIAGRTEDYREGVLSFLEKRKPVFKGK